MLGWWIIGTIAKGAALLHQEGAREVYACTTHAVFRYMGSIYSIVPSSIFLLHISKNISIRSCHQMDFDDHYYFLIVSIFDDLGVEL